MRDDGAKSRFSRRRVIARFSFFCFLASPRFLLSQAGSSRDRIACIASRRRRGTNDLENGL